jgi:CAAX prenyl protease-like protein
MLAGYSLGRVHLTETVETPSNDEPIEGPETHWAAYVVPMVAFLLVTQLEPHAGAKYPLVYIAKMVVVTICVLLFRAPLRDFRPEGRVLLPAILVGAAVFAEWIWLGPLTHYPHLPLGSSRAEYNPFVAIANPALRVGFLAARFYGLVLLVPIVEEVFWRSFLLRYITDPDRFWRQKPWDYSWTAFAVVAVGFGLSHPEWLEAMICAAAYGLLLRQTRSLFACVVAHSVTNLMLGVYVVTQHEWKFW